MESFVTWVVQTNRVNRRLCPKLHNAGQAVCLNSNDTKCEVTYYFYYGSMLRTRAYVFTARWPSVTEVIVVLMCTLMYFSSLSLFLWTWWQRKASTKTKTPLPLNPFSSNSMTIFHSFTPVCLHCLSRSVFLSWSAPAFASPPVDFFHAWPCWCLNVTSGVWLTYTNLPPVPTLSPGPDAVLTENFSSRIVRVTHFFFQLTQWFFFFFPQTSLNQL